MAEIFKRLAQIPHDKLLHSFYGTLMYSLLVFVSTPLLSLILVTCVAVAKEVYDEVTYGGFSPADIGFTVLVPCVLALNSFMGFK